MEDEGLFDFDPQDGPGLFDAPSDAEDSAADVTSSRAETVVTATEDVPDDSVERPRHLDSDSPDVPRSPGGPVTSTASPPPADPDAVPPTEPAASAVPPTESAASAVPPTESAAPAVPPTRPDPPPAPLALYRRYRPDVFADVIGQEHVTEPLQRALVNNRVNHAYLFSGPRGCGKTTSARILARALNCEQGPTAQPCGTCQSCRDLSRGGPGSIDVIEIDAASHGGVDDARDLRERAFFAPVHSRYKIYIVDEAHMVTTAGFNALLKVVEEPPPHVKFIFATTEPEKVIGTIRSRTHHYPFRLVPPKVLGDYLRTLCEAEGVDVEPAVLPLVVRAGAGSVRDSLSVLDQLLGGAGERGVTYEQSVALLGYTPEALLDEMVDALAAGDGAGVFSTIDRVVDIGQDPRRFAEDLLRRLRDLVIVAAVPDAVASGLLDVSADQADRLVLQAQGLGAGELTRAAEVVGEGLVAMRGTTAPRLHLELMCARILLPGADVDDRGVHARLDRLERRLGMPADEAGAPSAAREQGPERSAPAPRDQGRSAPDPTTKERFTRRTYDDPPPEEDWIPPADRDQAKPRLRLVESGDGAPTRTTTGNSGQSRTPPAPQAPDDVPERPAATHAVRPPRHDSPPTDSASSPSPKEPTPPAEPAAPEPEQVRPEVTVADVRRFWPNVLDLVKNRRKFTWLTVSQNAQVSDVRDGVLELMFSNVGARDHFLRGGSDDVLHDALVEVLGADLRISAAIEAERTATPESAAPRRPPLPEPSPRSPETADELTEASPATPSTPETPADPPARDSGAESASRSSDDEPDYDLSDPEVGEADAETLLRDMLQAEAIDDEQT